MARRKRRLPGRNSKGRFVKRGGHTARRTRRGRRRSNPVRAVRRRTRSHTRRARRSYRRRSNPARRTRSHSRRRSRRRSYARNPIKLNVRGFIAGVKTAVVGAVGAVVVEKGLSYLPASVAATAMSGKMVYVTKAAAAFLLGTLGQMLGAKAGRIASEMAIGSLTVTAYQALHNEVLPAVGMAGLGYWGSGMVVGQDQGGVPGNMAGLGSNMGEYVGPMAGMHGISEYMH